MLYGRVKTTLTNTITGKQTVIESENIVTNALLQFSHLIGTNWTGVYPIYDNGLSDLLLFREPLVENVNAYKIPQNNPIVGGGTYYNPEYYTNQKAIGTFIERQIIDANTVMSKWVFPAGVSTGKISALARTMKEAGHKPYFCPRTISPTNTTILPNGNLGKLVYYDETNRYLYGLYTADTSTTGQVSYEVRRKPFKVPPFLTLTDHYVNEQTSSSFPYETVATFSISDVGENCSYNPYYDSHDKCIYMDLGPISSGYMRYIKINPLTWTMQDLTVSIPNVNAVVVAGDGATAQHTPYKAEHGIYSHGYLYYAVAGYPNNTYDIYQVDLATGDYTSVNTYSFRFNNNPAPVLIRTFTEEIIIRGHSWRDCGFLVSGHDMSKIIEVPNYGGELINSTGTLGALNDNGIFYSWNSSSYLECDSSYLGTIYNYSTPIQKTANDDLTIEYTLTVED